MKKFLMFRRRKRTFPLYLLDKRQKFAGQTIVLTVGLLITQLSWEEYRLPLVAFWAAVAYVLTAWSLTENIKKGEWILLFILPVLFTASFSLFYFLLPARWVSRFSILILFTVGMYAVLLVENIYNVAASRSIQLLRAARSVGLLLTLVVVFLTANIVYSLRLIYWQNTGIIFSISFLLALQSLWSVELDQKISRKVMKYAIVVALGSGQLAGVFSFWPVENATYSLIITAGFYTAVSIIQQYFLGRMFRNTIQEYVIVFIFTLLLTIFTTRWG